MNSTDFVAEALAPISATSLVGDRWTVSTHCLYPSNAAVTVYVTGGPNSAVVSDEGGAIDELSTHNRVVTDIERERLLRRFCRPGGLKSKEGKIYSPPVTSDQLTSAIMLVANASAAAARWGLENVRLQHRRNLRRELHSILQRRFEEKRIEIDRKLTGKSSRSYRFDRVVRINEDRLLVIDAVLPDATSINANAIAHIDLRQLEDESIMQRMVYDDEDEWNSADLNLLQMAATLIPISNLSARLERIAR